MTEMLIELANQVRQYTLHCLKAPDSSLAMWAPPGTSNHILWHAGHALWVQDLLTVEALTGHSELPAGWEAKFGSASRPGEIKVWPSLDEVCSRLEKQLGRVQELFATRAEQIQKEADRISDRTGWPLLPGIIHGWHDEARHHGEIYLLIKLQRDKQ